MAHTLKEIFWRFAVSKVFDELIPGFSPPLVIGDIHLAAFLMQPEPHAEGPPKAWIKKRFLHRNHE
jgi:hypothetical protein